jgi:hypothetical protein
MGRRLIRGRTVYEAPAIIGTCVNCISPGSFSATLALIVIGAFIALTAERRNLACVGVDKQRQTKRPPEGGLSVSQSGR